MILFLDFDGVLHAELGDQDTVLCRVDLIWQILRTFPNVNVVFSTSWREVYPFDELLNFVTYGGGEDLAHRFIGSTPILDDEGIYGRRDIEIERWVAANNYTGPWIALDDMETLFNGGNNNLHLVNPDTGLTDEDVSDIAVKIRNAGTGKK